MNTRAKGIAIAAVLLVLAVAIGIRSHSSRQRAEAAAHAANPFAYPQLPSGALELSKALAGQPQLYELMSRSKVSPRLANYISQAQMEVLGQSDTSFHFVLRYPDKNSIDETLSIAADPAYQPSPVDVERAARAHSNVHAPKLTSKKTGNTQWQITLQYHLPYGVLPAELLQKLQQTKSSRFRLPDFLDPIPTVHADGGLPAGEAVVSAVANFFATYYDKKWEMEAHSVGVDVPLALLDLLDDALTLKGWMSELGEVEDCAKNPTNPLSQKASHDSNYQNDVLNQLNGAKGDVMSTIAPTLASDTAGFITHWLPFGAGAAAGVIFSTQDEAVSQYAENRIQEAQKYVVPCHNEELTAGQYRPMKGTLIYDYNLGGKECRDDKCVVSSDERHFEGTLTMIPDQFGFLVGKGTGKYKGKQTQHAWDRYCKSEGWSEETQGAAEIDAQAGGDDPSNGVIQLHAGSNDASVTSNGTTCNGAAKPTTTSAGGVGFSCEFHGVDFINGGTVSTFQTGDAHGTCKLELSRQ